MTTTGNTTLDTAKLEQFVFRAVDEVGATLNTALVVMGDRLGLYRGLRARRPGGSGPDAAGRRGRGLHALPQRRGHAVRRRLRGAPLIAPARVSGRAARFPGTS
jgi:hypothetical protein